MYEKLLWSYLEALDGLLRLLPSFVANSNLRNVDSACDKIDYPERS